MTRKQMGSKILGQQQILEKLIDNLPSMIYLKDAEGRLLACSQNLADFLKVSREGAIGKTSLDLLPSEIAKKQLSDDLLVIATGNTVKTEERIEAPDGEYIYQTVKLPIRDEDGNITGLCGISTDITEQKMAEQKLRESEERYRLLFEKSSDAILITCPDGIITSANSTACKMFGMTVEEFCQGGRSAIIDTSDQRLNDALKTRASTGEFSGELNFIRKNGEIFPGEIVSNIYNDSIGGIRASVRIRDVSERKLADEALRSKTAEMEQFTYSVSHDMRSPLVTVKTFLGYLEQDMASGKTERIAEDLQFIRGAADKMELMLGELLEYSRVGRIANQPTIVSFHQLADEALSAVAGRITELKVAMRVDDFDLKLYGDRPRLAQVWQNLIDNAVKYLGDQSRPFVQIGAEVQSNETVFFVRDNGIGVDLENFEKIFGMFTKLDTQSRGAGLGLATVKRIVEMYGGRIWVESEGIGHGSCFLFTLPDAVMKVELNS